MVVCGILFSGIHPSIFYPWCVCRLKRSLYQLYPKCYYGILFGGMHPVVFISMMCMWIETFHVSIIASNATMIVCGILFSGMHPVVFVSMMCM